MSLSEIFDNGSPHPWANLRVNNITIDNNILQGTYTSVSGTPVTFTDTAAHNVFSYTLPTTNNASIVFKYTAIAKGGPAGNFSNTLCRTAYYLFQINSGTVTSTGAFGESNNQIGFSAGSIVTTFSNTSNIVNFSVQNTSGPQTTQWTWYIEIYSINPSI
jgi:hypothetical protein